MDAASFARYNCKVITTLIFDCFGVLYSGTRTYLADQAPAHRRQELEELFDQADYGYITGAEFSDQAAALLDMTPDTLEEHTKHLYVRNDALINDVRKYRGQYKVGLLSNVSDSVIAQLFAEHELAELFDEVVLSSSVGMIKPSVAIFELTATRLGSLPEECVMIDDLERNIAGARDAGMHGIVYRSAETFARDTKALGI